MRHPRWYLDTSVFGGRLDEEFAADSRRPFSFIGAGGATVLLSRVLLRELAEAPAEVREVLLGLPLDSIERLDDSPEVAILRDEYIRAGVLSGKWIDDAWHVAMATCAHADLIVSWNFRHLVNVSRIRGFNAANMRLGFSTIDIRTPKEALPDEDEGD